MWKVKNIWIDEKNSQVGVRIQSFGKENIVFDVPIEQLSEYKNNLRNAEVTSYGLRKKRGTRDITRKLITREVECTVSNYTPMHADIGALKLT